jgi:pyrroline-5-carboxylate reductase
MHKSTLGFIGAGNMARSLIGGLISDGFPPGNIRASDASPEQLNRLQEHFPIETVSDNISVAEQADTLVLAVKPDVIHEVATQIADTVAARGRVVISIAAGIRVRDLEHWLGTHTAIVRAMPNTPALVQSGATALYANPRVSEEGRDLAESILRAVGLTLWLEDEALMDTVTALSGSGPAYFFLIMEILESAGIDLGLDPPTARLLTMQTALGAAKMALESSEDVAILRQRVTSPGGTTERALGILEEGDLRALITAAVRTAHDRSRELADKLGRE